MELRASDESFTLGHQLALWEQWVKELERGQRWVPEDLDAAWATRDDLDASLQLLGSDQRERVLAFVDALDRRFRAHTVPAPAGVELPPALSRRKAESPANWWHGRIPHANDQRLYLFADLFR